ncbi:hypothetical protein V498_06770 [Pseudogymnoascus sp. VKM F-4517 (FW-2822)]|nr:hypothetical protein V498_06770 [Pseudogymnoascus sp. VKM F-4517 (FW-2822)]
MEWPKFTNPFIGIKPPPGVHVPEREELLGSVCAERSPRSGFPYPPEAPTFWIKYGYAVYWNEVCGQTVAYHGLRQLKSPVRAPGVYYAFKEGRSTYIVMEYIPGKTAGQCSKESQDEAGKENICRSIGLAVSELHRIAIPEEFRVRPAAISGGAIRHSLFDDLVAPRHYENVEQLEIHINAFLELTKRKSRVHDLARELMVFCQSDHYHENFIIDADNHIIAIDFADSSIVPSSLAKYAAFGVGYRLHFDFHQWVEVPATEGIDNTSAIMAVSGPIVMGSSSFTKLGRRLPGGDGETQDRINMSLSPEVRCYPSSLGPTLGEVIAAQEANDKLRVGVGSSQLPYTTMETYEVKPRPRIPRPPTSYERIYNAQKNKTKEINPLVGKDDLP